MRANDLASQGRHITMTNIGNPHGVGQKPLTFFRQVGAATTSTPLFWSISRVLGRCRHRAPPPPLVPCAVFYLVPRLIGCGLGRGTRCCDQFGAWHPVL